MKYVSFVCRKCGRAQGTQSQTLGKCKICGCSNYLNKPLNSIKILLVSDNLGEITQKIKEYNLNQENIYYSYQKKKQTTQ
jgi:predicted ATP-dependent serine protease